MQVRLEVLAGGIVLAITSLDVFLAVLYARACSALLTLPRSRFYRARALRREPELQVAKSSERLGRPGFK
jgi:hypothetical protein